MILAGIAGIISPRRTSKDVWEYEPGDFDRGLIDVWQYEPGDFVNSEVLAYEYEPGDYDLINVESYEYEQESRDEESSLEMLSFEYEQEERIDPDPRPEEVEVSYESCAESVDITFVRMSDGNTAKQALEGTFEASYWDNPNTVPAAARGDAGFGWYYAGGGAPNISIYIADGSWMLKAIALKLEDDLTGGYHERFYSQPYVADQNCPPKKGWNLDSVINVDEPF